MRWFRSNRTIGGVAALAALALQFALSFAHLHPADLYRRAPAAAFAIATSGPTAVHRHDAAPSLRRESRAPAEAYCDICASINLVSSSQDAAVPRLPIPPLLNSSQISPADAAALAVRRHVHFQSRAPPSA